MFDERLVKKLGGRERYTPMSRLFMRIMARLGLTDMYWNGLLKKNNAYQDRYARPDLPAE